MASLFVPIKDYEVESGNEVRLTALVIGERDKNKRRLVWSNKEGLVQNGQFRAPEIDEDKSFEVKVHMEADTTKTEIINVLVRKKEVKPERPRGKVAEIKSHGENGKYSLSVQILNERGFGYECPIAFIEEGDQKKTVLPQNPFHTTTNNQGFILINLEQFKEKERIIYVCLQGTDLDKRIVLNGPKPKKKTWQGKCDPQAGFWKNLMQKKRRTI